MRLQGVCPQHEGAAETQLELGNLQLGAAAPDDHPFFTPIKLKSFSRRKGQGHIHSLARQIRGLALVFTPLPGKGRDTVIGTAIAQAYQINMRAPLKILLFRASPI